MEVVAHAHDKASVEVRERVVGEGARASRSVEINEHVVLMEAFGELAQVALGADKKAVAVEEEAVVSADLRAVDNGAFAGFGSVGTDFDAHVKFLELVGRGGEV